MIYISIAIFFLVAVFLVFYRRSVFQKNREQYPVKIIPSFLSEAECDHLINLAATMVNRSNVILDGKTVSNSVLRTSRSAYFTGKKDALTETVKARIADLSKTDIHCQEPLQVTYYKKTEFYAPHYDALIAGGVNFGQEGDRYCTVILYLNDNFKGGVTRFNKLNLRIKPEKGKAVLFYNLDENGKQHPLSLHCADPVLSGEKWLLNQWIRQRPFS